MYIILCSLLQGTVGLSGKPGEKVVDAARAGNTPFGFDGLMCALVVNTVVTKWVGVPKGKCQ